MSVNWKQKTIKKREYQEQCSESIVCYQNEITCVYVCYGIFIINNQIRSFDVIRDDMFWS
jgi:hypothetical protein